MPSYTVTLEKDENGWRAWCLLLPECQARGKNQKQAYVAIKGIIREHIKRCLREGRPIPIDRTTTKFFRVDVKALRESAELR